jgi:predicted O-methyltransferase YrrM
MATEMEQRKRREYTEIPGWFAEEAFYDFVVQGAPAEGLFVEIGCWLGKSTCYLGHAIQGSGKKIRLVAVDTWKGSANEPGLLAAVEQAGGSVFGLFWRNMREAGLEWLVEAVVRPSVEAAGLVADGSCDFVFIDADHTYEAVRADIAAWRSKVKAGGILAGHDWCVYEDVRKAVTEGFGAPGRGFQTMGNVWYTRL